MPMRKEKSHYAFDLRSVEKLIPPSCTYRLFTGYRHTIKGAPLTMIVVAGPPRLKKLVIDCCKANPNDRPDFKGALNTLKDIQREVEIEESRGDRGRSVLLHPPYCFSQIQRS